MEFALRYHLSLSSSSSVSSSLTFERRKGKIWGHLVKTAGCLFRDLNCRSLRKQGVVIFCQVHVQENRGSCIETVHPLQNDHLPACGPLCKTTSKIMLDEKSGFELNGGQRPPHLHAVLWTTGGH